VRQFSQTFFRAVALAALSTALLLTAAAAQTPTWGEVRATDKIVSIRLKPDARSPLVRALSPGTTVRVDFFKPGGWCALFDMTETQRDETKALGYVDCSLLVTPDKAAAARPEPAPKATPAAAKAGQQRQVEAKTEVRRERNLTSAVTAVLAPGEQILTGFARDGYVAVFRMNDPATKESTAIGYIPEGMARPLDQAPKAAAPKPVAPKAAGGAGRKAQPEGKSAPAPEIKSGVKQNPETPKAQAPGQDSVRITSDRMVYNQTENSVVFIGNVHGTPAAMAIWSNKLTAYFTEKARIGLDSKAKAADKPQQPGEKAPGDFGDKIERIVAEGNVRLVAGKNEGACGQLTYFVAEGMLRMDQTPILRDGQNPVRGAVIKHYLRENRSEVLGGSQRRVEAVFSSSNKGEQK